MGVEQEGAAGRQGSRAKAKERGFWRAGELNAARTQGILETVMEPQHSVTRRSRGPEKLGRIAAI